ncbi:MAG: LssY C-terminal domain-containing protein [Thermoguttaceae bacterium]|jgi:hypothetical protein
MDSDTRSFPAKKRLSKRVLYFFVLILAIWFLAAYFLIPTIWRGLVRRHPALEDAPRVTHTASGISGDPLNIALVGSKEDLVAAMLAAKWYPADALTLKNCLRIAADTVFRRSYEDAPVSNLFLWGHKEDLAFEQPVGGNPKQRHHVRFWRAEKVDEDNRPLWMGAVTFDKSVGFSHTTGQITHHIDANIDAERDRLIDDLGKAGLLTTVYGVDDFQEKLKGHNGGGDPYYTDGRLAVGVLRPSNK